MPLCLAVFPTRVTAFLFKAVLALLAFIAIFVSLHIFSKCRSESHTLRTMLVNHLSIMFMWIFGWWARKRLERESKDCRKVQEKMLMEIINNNKDTVYGREFSFESIKSAKDFMETHPLTTKSHYKEYAGNCWILRYQTLQRQKLNTVFHGLLGLPRCKNPGRGGGDSHIKGAGMLVGNFELNP